MSEFATIKGNVTYRAGDGPPIVIPEGRVEVALQPDSATLSWEDGPGITGVTAMPRDQFDRYVADGLIILNAK